MSTQPQSTKFFNFAIIVALLLSPLLSGQSDQRTAPPAAAPMIDAAPQAIPISRAPRITAAQEGTVRPASALSAAEKFHLDASEHFVVINSNGIEPATIRVEVGDSVTWHNATSAAVKLKSGTPPDDPGTPVDSNNIFLPIITGGGAQSVASAEQSTIPAADIATANGATASGNGEIDAQLAAGADFTYTFNSVATVAYYIDRSGYPTGRVLVEAPSATTILASSPANGEDGVATTRETIIEFTRPINAAGVTAANFTARFGSRTLEARLQPSADGKRVTLFYATPLPASARVQVTVNGDGISDSTGQKIDADGDGQPGGTATIDFDTLSVTVVPGTAVCGRVFASELAADGTTAVNVPLQGATITVDGMESTLKATTDSEGNFCLDPAPAGRFFVHIDGRTARNGVPTGAYYPFVGKAWGSVVGQQSSVGNIYLPLVKPGTLQDVSNSQETRIGFAPSVQQQFPEFAGVEIYVPANSLMRDDGTRGGKVGIAPVPPDRLPGELPEGLNFPLVVTVQTDGATNFDKPAPICFPNLPDPDTNVTLAAGEKSALWSFNHDTGRFEVVGPMTVSDDGTLVCTDPGVGVPAPGWHGSQPGTPVNPLPSPKPPCEIDKGLCILSSTMGAIDCAMSFIPGGGCALSVTWGILSTFRDCTLDWAMNGHPGSGCGITTGATVGGIVADCVIKSIPGLGSAFACGGAAAATVKDCTCIGSNKQSSIFAASDSAAIIDAKLDFLEARLKLTWVIYGSPVWTSIKLENTSDLRKASQVAEILEKVGTASQVGSEQDTLIANREAEAIRALPRPTEITANDVDRLLNYINQTSQQWSAGVYTHDEAGRSDFIDMEQLKTSFNDLEKAYKKIQLLKLEQETYYSIHEDIFIDAIKQYNDSSSPVYSTQHIYYAIQNDLDGQVLRGKFSNSRQLNMGALSPQTPYHLYLYHSSTDTYGYATFWSADNGRPTELPQTVLYSLGFDALDMDDDKLYDLTEFVVGTDPNNPDTDNDGIPDGTEVQNGTDPLDGIAARTGVVGTADTPGTALDVCVANNLAAVADGDAGVALFNVFDGMNPTIVAQVDTPGTAQAIACDNGLVAVADKDSGIAIIDTSNPANAVIRKQVALTGAAQAVATVNSLVYAGSASGQLAVIDSVNGEILGTVNLGEAIDEIAVSGDNLYLLTKTALVIYALWDGGLSELGRTTAEGRVSPLEFGRKLFVGGNRAYVGHFTGYAVFDVSNPATPRLQGTPPATQAAIHGMASTGSGELVAVTSFSGPSSLAVSLYDDSNPTDVTKFLTSYDTPGSPRAVAIHNGLAYIADSTAGLQVVNYLSYDNGRTAPTLTLGGSFNGDRVEENKLTRVTANATDDVQIRLVDFYVNGTLVATDGSYPFEQRFVTPRMADQATVKLRVSAIDTGGNETWTNEQTLTLVPDATPPRVLRYTPAAGTNPADSVRGLTVTFSEALNRSTLTAANFNVVAAGADNQLGTGDDTLLTGGTIAFDTDTNTAALTFGSPLAAGIYRATVAAAISDPAGNKLANALVWDFGVGQRIPIGTVIAGEIGVAGEQDVYNFVATPGQRVYFDDQNASRPSYFYWKLQDTSGTRIFEDTINGDDPGVYYLELGGEYTLTVWGYQTTTGTYQFQLRSNPPDEFAIAIGDIIKDGQPSSGAGRIEIPGNRNRYTFTATPNQRVYFDDRDASRSGYFYWGLYDSSGTRIFEDTINGNDPGVHDLEKGGTYTIITWSYVNTAGTYEFQLRSIPPDEFTINIGDIVSNGQPGTGAGNIELPGNRNRYTFTATPNQRVYFDDRDASRSGYFYWGLYDSDGTRIFEDTINGNDPGVHELKKGGEYTIITWSYVNTAGTYQFQLRSNPPDEFTINIGTTVKDGEPGPGAGKIEAAGNFDVYHFTVTPGQQVYFDDQGSSSNYRFDWQLVDSTGKQIFLDAFNDSDPGVRVLDLGGQYTIYVWADADVTGTYQFQIRMGTTASVDGRHTSDVVEQERVSSDEYLPPLTAPPAGALDAMSDENAGKEATDTPIDNASTIYLPLITSE